MTNANVFLGIEDWPAGIFSVSWRLVCVSNRVSIPRKAAAPGGLAVGVLGALQRTGGVWFGWGGELTDSEPRAPEVHTHDRVTYVTTELQRTEFQRYYNGFANDALWPLFHCMPTRFRFRPEEQAAYEGTNVRFAQTLQPLLKSGDRIWVHDYHLIPMGRCLREVGVRAPLGFFLHIPFPPVQIIRVLPTYANLIRDLTAYDVLGFQTEGDLASFVSCVEHVFGKRCIVDDGYLRIGPRTVHCDVFPIGIDVSSVQREAAEAVRRDTSRRMVQSLLGRKLVIGVDRLDYSKGLVERFASYERFLEAFPENRGQVTYLQVAPLSRKDVPSYAEIRRLLEQAAGRTNGQFADADWTPIRYLNRNFSHDTLMGLLRVARVGLVTPLRDGMNLVAKEYLAAQDPDDPGVLVLSTLAGAAVELTAALQVNPYDCHAVAHAIQIALSMSTVERRTRHAQLLDTLRHNDIGAWCSRFLDALQETARSPVARLAGA
jgi:trehalose 6-phosphate synthase